MNRSNNSHGKSYNKRVKIELLVPQKAAEKAMKNFSRFEDRQQRERLRLELKELILAKCGANLGYKDIAKTYDIKYYEISAVMHLLSISLARMQAMAEKLKAQP